LHELTGDERAGLGTVPAYRPKSTRIRVLNMSGEPIAGLAVTVVPAGDRLRGRDAMPAEFELVTSKHGWIEFPFPASTQVRLTSEEHELGMTRLLPDWLRKYRVTATPRDTLSVQVRRSNEQMPLPDSIRLRPRRIARGHTTDASILLHRVRRLDRDRSLYAADRVTAVSGLGLYVPRSGIVRMVTEIQGQPARTFDVDVSGGQTSPFDLRLDLVVPVGPTTTPGNRRRRRPGGGTRPKGRNGKDGRPGRDAPRDDVSGASPANR